MPKAIEINMNLMMLYFEQFIENEQVGCRKHHIVIQFLLQLFVQYQVA